MQYYLTNMMKFITKLLISLTLFSSCFPLGIFKVIYKKDPIEIMDGRYFKAFNWLNKHMTHDSNDVQLIPVSAYKQEFNGINYKIIGALKDEKNQRVNLVDSVVHFRENAESIFHTPEITYHNTLPNTFDEKNESLISGIQKFISNDGTQIKSINSITSAPSVNENEKIYLVNAFVDSKSKPYSKYFILSQAENKDLTNLQTFDFPLEN